VRNHGLRASLDRERSKGIYPDVALREPRRHVADQDVIGIGERLEPSGEMGGVADGRVVHPEIVSDAADHDEPAVESHPHAQGCALPFGRTLVEGEQRLTDAQSGIDSPERVLLERHRRTKERHQSISEKLVDGSLVPVDGLRHQPEGFVHDLVHPFRAELFRQAVGFDHVAEEDGDPFPLAFQGTPRGEDAFGEMFRRVGRRSAAGCP
jgi:hypothetical protein